MTASRRRAVCWACVGGALAIGAWGGCEQESPSSAPPAKETPGQEMEPRLRADEAARQREVAAEEGADRIEDVLERRAGAVGARIESARRLLARADDRVRAELSPALDEAADGAQRAAELADRMGSAPGSEVEGIRQEAEGLLRRAEEVAEAVHQRLGTPVAPGALPGSTGPDR